MADYTKVLDPLTGVIDDRVVARADGALIPADPANTDWQAYQAWLEAGNTPAAPDGPPSSPPAKQG